MFGSSVLDVALGLIFLYLLLSLLCTSINEFIESLLKNRPKDLERGLRDLLGDPDGTKVVQKLYEHPLIGGLFKGSYEAGGKNLPSYLQSRQFTLALLDIIRPANALNGASPPSPGTAAQPSPQHQISGATFVTAPPASPPVAASATGEAPSPATAGLATNTIITNLRQEVANTTVLGDSAKRAILTLIDAAGNDVTQVLQNLESWYDGAMDHVSSWYRRRTQWISLIVGMILAVGINADTFAVAKSLSRDQALRSSIASSAQLYTESHAETPATGTAKEPGGQTKGPRKIKDVVDEFNEVHEVGWPLGWDRDDRRKVPWPPQWDRFVAEWVLKFFGWVITAVAISLGAPFWFDTLNKVAVIRSTVRPTQKSPPEPPIDK